MSKLQELENLIDLMVRRKAFKVSVEGMQVELDPAAFHGPIAAGPSLPEDLLCPCGHGKFVYHPDGLCLQGCSETLCQSDESSPEF